MTMSESTITGGPVSAIAAIPIAAIWIREVRRYTERFVEHALRLCAPRLLGRAAMGGQVLIERRADDLGQRASVVRAQFLDAITLLLSQVHLGTSCRSHIQRSIQHIRMNAAPHPRWDAYGGV